MGTKVRVIYDRYCPIHKGMEGIIDGKSTFDGRTFYSITATNFGPKMRNTDNSGDKNVFAWTPKNWRRLPREAFEIISD